MNIWFYSKTVSRNSIPYHSRIPTIYNILTIICIYSKNIIENINTIYLQYNYLK